MEDKIFCPNCGAEIEGNKCAYCGYIVSEKEKRVKCDIIEDEPLNLAYPQYFTQTYDQFSGITKSIFTPLIDMGVIGDKHVYLRFEHEKVGDEHYVSLNPYYVDYYTHSRILQANHDIKDFDVFNYLGKSLSPNLQILTDDKRNFKIDAYREPILSYQMLKDAKIQGIRVKYVTLETYDVTPSYIPSFEKALSAFMVAVYGNGNKSTIEQCVQIEAKHCQELIDSVIEKGKREKKKKKMSNYGVVAFFLVFSAVVSAVMAAILQDTTLSVIFAISMFVAAICGIVSYFK